MPYFCDPDNTFFRFLFNGHFYDFFEEEVCQELDTFDFAFAREKTFDIANQPAQLFTWRQDFWKMHVEIGKLILISF